MRFEGTLRSWNDERGFGFIEPTLGGPEIFVHVSAMPGRPGRPQEGERFSFEVELNAGGKKRARNVQMLPAARAGRPPPQAGRARGHAPPAHRGRPVARQGWGGASLLAIPLFIALYAVVAITTHVPLWVAGAYGAMSVVCFMAYAMDKSAAQARRWRVSESSLLLWGLACGWPGGLLAQQLLRHKTQKRSFQLVFWCTVLLNAAAFVLLHSPMAAGWLPRL